MDNKQCSKCKIEKPISEFYRHASSSTGYKSACKSCYKAEKTRPRTKDERKCYSHGITREELAKINDGVSCCQICSKTNAKKSLSIDHDHSTGAIRGLLCYRCNYILGMIGDDANLLEAMAKYIHTPPLAHLEIKSKFHTRQWVKTKVAK